MGDTESAPKGAQSEGIKPQTLYDHTAGDPQQPAADAGGAAKPDTLYDHTDDPQQGDAPAADDGDGIKPDTLYDH